MDFSFKHEFDVDVANYWKIFLSEPFQVDMYGELKMKKREVLQLEDDGAVMRRSVHLEPSTAIPDFLKAVIKGTDYIEHDTLRWADNVMDVVIEPSMLKDRFKMGGVYAVTPLDGGKRCQREFRGTVKVSIPLLGGRVEKYMMEQLRDSYEVASGVTRRWIEQKRKAGEIP